MMYKCYECNLTIDNPEWRTEMLDDEVRGSEFSWPVCPHCGEEVFKVYECPHCKEMTSETEGELCDKCKDELSVKLYKFFSEMTEDELRTIEDDIMPDGLLAYAYDHRIIETRWIQA